MRLDKFLKDQGIGSRQTIKKLLKKNTVTVNDAIITDGGYQVNPTIDCIKYDGEILTYQKHVTLMMNKPKGYVSASKDHLHDTLLSLIKTPYDHLPLKIIGRLDKDSEGLILLTTDGTLVHHLTSPKKKIYKTYEVTLDQPFQHTHEMQQPFQIKDAKGKLYIPNQPQVTPISERVIIIKIQEGKFHQIKRMCQHFGYEVIKLKRLAIGSLHLDPDLETGAYKEIHLHIEDL